MVGFVGVVTNHGPNGISRRPRRHLRGLRIYGRRADRRGYAPMKERCDVLVALTHIGSEKDRELADLAPGFDVVVGGRSHEQINEVATACPADPDRQEPEAYRRDLSSGCAERPGGGISYRMIPLGQLRSDRVSGAGRRLLCRSGAAAARGRLSRSADKTGLARLSPGRPAGGRCRGSASTTRRRTARFARRGSCPSPRSTISTLRLACQHGVDETAQLRRMIVAKFNEIR